MCAQAVLQSILTILAMVSFISTIASYLRSHTVPLQGSLCLLYSQAICLLLGIDFNFEKTTTADCSVPILKCLGDEASPSH